MKAILSAILTLVLVAVSFGQDESSGASASVDPLNKIFSDGAEDTAGDSLSIILEDEGAEEAANELGMNDKITVDYPSEEIRTVLRNVADLYMLNLVIPEELVGTTSIKLREVSWEQIFAVVLKPVGFTHIEEGNIIKVVSLQSLNYDPPVTEIYVLNYADAGEISPTISNMVSPDSGGQVQIDVRTNSLIVTERPSKIEQIAKVIERLDKPTQQVMIETRFIEMTDSDVQNIGINWVSLRGYGLQAGPFNKSVDSASSRNGSSDAINDSNNLTNLSDVERSAVFNRGTDDEYELSLSGNGSGSGRIGDFSFPTTDASSFLSTQALNNLSNLASANSITRNSTSLFSADQFSLVISALSELNDTELVSNPTLVTMNNVEALISIGVQYPIPQYAYNQETGGFVVSGFDFKDIGIILRVKPSINNKGMITMKVTPEVSKIEGTVPFDKIAIPIIGTRRTETQVILRDGYTMGIGGLMERSNADQVSNVPGLSRIPGIGKLFRHKSKNEQVRNLLVFITAKILPGEGSTYKDVFDEERMNGLGIDLGELAPKEVVVK